MNRTKLPIRAVFTLNDQAILINRTTRLMIKEYRRDTMRELCTEYDIHYNLRYTKGQMAKRILAYWLEKDQLDKFEEVARKAKAHWQERIDVKDLHRPDYYVMMLKIAEDVLLTLKEIEERRR